MEHAALLERGAQLVAACSKDCLASSSLSSLEGELATKPTSSCLHRSRRPFCLGSIATPTGGVTFFCGDWL